MLVATSFHFDSAVLQQQDAETRTAVLLARALDFSCRCVCRKKAAARACWNVAPSTTFLMGLMLGHDTKMILGRHVNSTRKIATESLQLG